MIIDDDEDVLFTYKKMLCNEGYKVITFLDPYEALKTFSLVKDPNFYQLIIIDIRMIGMNGFQLFYKFKNINKNIRILLVSA
jgi:DNA-binding NtrC family response regulator